jgi:hypothetical protein
LRELRVDGVFFAGFEATASGRWPPSRPSRRRRSRRGSCDAVNAATASRGERERELRGDGVAVVALARRRR